MDKDLTKMFSELDTKYKGKITLSFANESPKVEIIGSTGSFLLDSALESGGIPTGRIVEYFGAASGGKTSLSLITAAEVQKRGGVAAYLDIENSFNKGWAQTLGIDLEKLIYFQLQPGQGGDVAFDVMETFISSGKVNFIILDSVSALATNAEIQGEYSDAHIGQLARLMSGGLKKINNALSGTNCSVAFINQIRTDIKNYGAFETTSGGKALEFYASIRLNVKRDSFIGTEKDVQGYVTKIKIVKNKVGTPFRTVLTNIYKNKGINQDEEIFDTAVESKLIDKKGGWYSYKTINIGQGKEKAIASLIDSGEFQEIKQKVVDYVMSKIDTPIEGSFDHVVSRENKAVGRVSRTVSPAVVSEETVEE
jgi:recombination protein RecA